MEIYRLVPNTPYSVSNLGTLRNNKTGYILGGSLDTAGYRKTTYKGKNYYIHKLVCIAFNGDKPFDKAVVRHLDDNKLNNIASNLAWGTQRDNYFDARANSKLNPFSILTKEQIEYIRGELAVYSYGRASQLSREFNVHRDTISKIKLGINWDLLSTNEST